MRRKQWVKVSTVINAVIGSVESTEMNFIKGKKNQQSLNISPVEKGRISFHNVGFPLIHRVAKLLKCGKT